MIRFFAGSAVPPAGALELVNELEQVGVALLGAGTWYEVPGEPDALAEDVGVECNVPDDVLNAPDKVRRSFVRDFIRRGLADRTVYVSLDPTPRAR